MTPLNTTPSRDYWSAFLQLPSLPRLLFSADRLSGKDVESAKKELFKQFVCIVNIETSTYCNRSCLYCPIANHPRQNVYMPDHIFKKVLADLQSIQYSSTISLSLYNEPLADSSFYSRVEQTRTCCPGSFVKFNSNGDYLTKPALDRLVDIGVNAIFITLHPPAGAEYADEDRIRHFHAFFSKLKIDGQINSIVHLKNIVSDINYRGMRLLIQAHNWSVMGTGRGGAVPNLSVQARNMPCVRPLREFVISYNGSVFPCCQIFPDDKKTEQYKIDTISESCNIFDAYSSPILAAWRRKLFTFGPKPPPCGTCSDQDYSDLSSSPLRAALIRGITAAQDPDRQSVNSKPQASSMPYV